VAIALGQVEVPGRRQGLALGVGQERHDRAGGQVQLAAPHGRGDDDTDGPVRQLHHGADRVEGELQEPLGVELIQQAVLGQEQRIGQRGARVLPGAVRPGRAEGGIDVADRQQPRQRADLQFPQAVRIAGAVEAFVMPGHRLRQPGSAGQQATG